MCILVPNSIAPAAPAVREPLAFVFSKLTGEITLTPPLQIPGVNFSEKPGNNKTPPRSVGFFFGNNKTPPRSGGKFLNNKTPPRSGGKILSFFKAKTVKFCNKHTDLWTTINPRRRRGKFLKTTKTRREAAEIFLETTRPRTENPAKISLRGGSLLSSR